MDVITLPAPCTSDALLTTLQEAALLGSEVKDVRLVVPAGCFVTCGALAFLTTWGLRFLDRGGVIQFTGDAEACRYLSRMNLFQHLGVRYRETFARHDETGRFTPIRLIAEEEDVKSTTNEILELVLRQFDEARAFVPAVEWVIYEMVDNIRLHAQAPVPGAVCAQYFPKRHRLDVAICDVGCGIKGSLQKQLQPWEGPGAAINLALQRGVTRDPATGQGNGLPGALAIVEKNTGNFRLWTEDVVFDVERGTHKGFTQRPRIDGTGVVVRLDTNTPVQLSDTFLGAPTWTYIDYEIDRLQEAGGLSVKDDCINTGTRAPAERLRRKILAMLPDMDQRLMLDFRDIESASSSFLDELLGRLVAEMGLDTFNEKVELVNLKAELVDMANVVIGQRLEG